MQHILTAELLFLTFVKRTKNARLEILKMFKDFPFSVLNPSIIHCGENGL